MVQVRANRRNPYSKVGDRLAPRPPTSIGGETSWWGGLFSLIPFMLKLGVPVVTLLFVYIALGGHRPKTGENAADKGV